MVRLSGVLFFLVVLTGCVTPAPPGDVANFVVSDVQAGTAESGSNVRWGGTVVGVNSGSDLTTIEVVSRPLSQRGRPQHNDETFGRFLAEISGFADAETLEVGRDVTFTGTVGEVREGRIDQATYSYPVLSVYQYHFWETERKRISYWEYYNDSLLSRHNSLRRGRILGRGAYLGRLGFGAKHGSVGYSLGYGHGYRYGYGSGYGHSLGYLPGIYVGRYGYSQRPVFEIKSNK